MFSVHSKLCQPRTKDEFCVVYTEFFKRIIVEWEKKILTLEVESYEMKKVIFKTVEKKGMLNHYLLWG